MFHYQIVDGTDVSELLMENVAKFPVDGILIGNMSIKDVKEMTTEPLNNFRELLLQGNKSEALGQCFCLFYLLNSKSF